MREKQGKLCQMEVFHKDGLCERPATYIWTPPDGKTVLVCERCLPCVVVNGCDVSLIEEKE